MIKKAPRFQSKLMRVAVYRVENPFGPFPLLNHGESAFNLQLKLRCLAREEVYGKPDETAAACMYFETVGRHRVQRLKALDAPTFIISAESDLKYIESQLRPISFLDKCAYLLDNGVEAWVITVDWDSEEQFFGPQFNPEKNPIG